MMSSETRRFPDTIEIEDVFPSGTRLTLPQRDLGFVKGFALMTVIPIVAMALLFAILCFLSAAGVINRDAEGLSRYGFIPFGLFFGGVGAWLTIEHLFTFFGRTEIEMTSGRIQVSEVVGPWRRTESIPLRSVRQFNVVESRLYDGRRRSRRVRFRQSVTSFAGKAVLYVERAEAPEPEAIVWGYDKEFLSPLSDYLAQMVNREMLRPEGETVGVVSETFEQSLRQPRTTRPSGSRITVSRRDDDAVLKIPAAGVLRGSGGIVWFGLLFAVAPIVIGVVAWTFGEGGEAIESEYGLLAFFGFLVTFLLFGLSIFGWAVNRGLRRTTIRISDDRLQIEQVSPFGSRTHQWRREEIADVRVGASRIYVNRRPLMELQIHQQTGEHFGLLAAREHDELQWLATTVRGHLRLPHASSVAQADANRLTGAAASPSATSPAGVTQSDYGRRTTRSFDRLRDRRWVMIAVVVFLLLDLVIAGAFLLPFGQDDRQQSQPPPKQLLTLDGYHRKPVTAVDFCPSGGSVATASEDLSIGVWGVESANLRQRLTGHIRAVRDVAFSPDCRRLATGSDDRKIAIWDLSEPKVKHRLVGHTDRVLSVEFSPDGDLLASGSADGTVRLWSVESGKERATLTKHTGAVRAVGFSHNGRYLASAAAAPQGKSVGGEVIVWDMSEAGSPDLHDEENQPDKATPEPIHTLTRHEGGADFAVFSPDDRTLATASQADQTVRFWNAEKGTQIHLWPQTTGPLSYASDGQRLAVVNLEGFVDLRNIRSGEILRSYSVPDGDGGEITSLAFSPDGAWLAAGSDDTSATLWRVDGEPESRIVE